MYLIVFKLLGDCNNWRDLIGCLLNVILNDISFIYSTPKETHHLYVFTIVKHFNRRYLCYWWINCPEFLHATF